jgi:hypothetical protein
MKIKTQRSRKLVTRIYSRLLIIYQYFYGIKIRLIRKKNNPMVFCIGFPKTGTSSLDKALGILGYRNIHWPRAHIEPKCGWIEYIKKSPYDAFSDDPICYFPLLIEIDKEFPGSKYVYTPRDPESLAKSWQNYFKNSPWGVYDKNDKNKLIKRYNEYEKNVMNHFKNRPEDFLVLDILGGEKWEKLCKFLNKPVPDIPFPRKRVGKYKKKK